MGKPSGFLEFDRKDAGHRPVAERIGDFAEVNVPLSVEELTCQAARCMDCGIPFCHGAGCPLGLSLAFGYVAANKAHQEEYEEA